MGKNPCFLFYPNDWDRDLGPHPLEVCGAWMHILSALYWEGGTSTKTLDEWSKILRENRKKTEKILNYLHAKGIADLLKEDSRITVTSRRMVRDARIREIRKSAGSKGGHPSLTDKYNEPGFLYLIHRLSDGFYKIGISNNPTQRLYKIRYQHPNDTIEIARTYRVEDMGKTEKILHDKFSDSGKGEWFNVSIGDVESELKKLGVLLKEVDKEDSGSSVSVSVPVPVSYPNSTNKTKVHRATFQPPSLDDVKSYCQERNNNVNPEKWMNYYQSNGWMVGRNKMRDWKAAVRTWEREDGFKPKPIAKPVFKKHRKSCTHCGSLVDETVRFREMDVCEVCLKKLDSHIDDKIKSITLNIKGIPDGKKTSHADTVREQAYKIKQMEET